VDQQADRTIGKADLQGDLARVELDAAGYRHNAHEPVMIDAGDGHPIGPWCSLGAASGQTHHGPADVPPEETAVTGKSEQVPSRRVLAQFLVPDYPVEPVPVVLDRDGGQATCLRPAGQQRHPLVLEDCADLADQRER
jgi:hypothetical protein